jgi:bacillithiol synthase
VASQSPQIAPVAPLADESPNRSAVDLRRFPWFRRLATDYTFNFDALARFFNGNPAERSAWEAAISRAQSHRRDRDAVASIVAAQQRRRQAPDAARDATARLALPETVAIVTGQQAGLFGGPLFTLLKAISAIKLAAKVEQEHQVPAVAVFWVEAEDHDWNEVRSATVFDKDLNAVPVSLPPRADGDDAPVGTVCLDQAILTAIDDLEALLPQTEFRDELLTHLRAAYRPGVGMAEAFARWLEHVLGGYGLVVYDASDQASKPLVSHIFQRELSSPGETTQLANAAGAALATAGYHHQVQPGDDAVALFHLDNGRKPVKRQGAEFVAGAQRQSVSSFVALAAERPGLFSPNVLLRPIVQDTLFPTVCYVAGPNELAYLGQLRQVYERFSVPMPLFFSRATATIADGATVRFLHKYQLPLEALQPQDDSALNALLATQIPPVVEESFAAATEAIETAMARLIQAMPALDPTLEGAARTTLGKMQHDLTTLHGKTIHAAKRRDDTLRRQFARARAVTFPGGHAQERTIAFLAFQNQYGPALVERLMAQLPVDPGHHWVVTL